MNTANNPEYFFYRNPEKSVQFSGSGLLRITHSLTEARQELQTRNRNRENRHGQSGPEGDGEVVFFSVPFHGSEPTVYWPERISTDWIPQDGFAKKSSLRFLKHNPNRTEWNSIFEQAQNAIATTALSKLVLARQSNFCIEDHHSVFALLTELFSELFSTSHSGLACIAFGNENFCFFSKTPEMLFKLEGAAFETVALAGTRPDSQSDFNTAKDHIEHQIVVDAIADSIKTFSQNIQIKKSDVLKLPKLNHLRTQITADIHHNPDLDFILETLHPTPAVAGFPKTASCDWISQHEHFQRGQYAGVFGYLTQDVCEAMVTIRSGNIQGNLLSVYTGVGIVDKSDSASEWNELNTKLDQILEGLNLTRDASVLTENLGAPI